VVQRPTRRSPPPGRSPSPSVTRHPTNRMYLAISYSLYGTCIAMDLSGTPPDKPDTRARPSRICRVLSGGLPDTLAVTECSWWLALTPVVSRNVGCRVG